ncbi:TPA: hypothetical protein SLW25_001549 [Pseudomonas aeruginosa]|nr:hypothetical protein [Pseudomonas aeruginosa]
MSMELNKANECTCPSGDGSLVHPCPAHPAVEQAGANVGHGHVFPRADGVKMRCGGPGLCSECTADASRARAALAQPSPALPPFAEKVLAKLRRFYDCASDFESGGVDIGRHWLDLLTQLGLLNRVQRSPALWEISQQGEDLLGMPQPSPAQAEAERPEVVARVVHSNPVVLGQCGPLNANDELMTVAQHAASVARWAEMFNRVEQERDAALARVAELERQEPVALANRGLHAFWVKWTEAAAGLYGPGIKLYAAPVAQAQHSVPDAELLSDIDKHLTDWLDLHECECENGHICGRDHVRATRDKARKLLAAAAGKEVGHE